MRKRRLRGSRPDDKGARKLLVKLGIGRRRDVTALVQEKIHRRASGRFHRHGDGRERRRAHCGIEDIVKANQADVLRHPDATRDEAPQSAERHHVVVGDERSRPCVHCEIRGLDPTLEFRHERPEFDQLYTVRARRREQAPAPFAIRPGLARPAQVR